MSRVTLGSGLFLVTILTACGGGSMSTNNNTPPPPPTVNANVSVSSATNGAFDVAMSTSFQPAEWDYTLFQQFPNATTPLGNLQPHHVRLQGISQGVPQGSAGSNSTSWDFNVLDSIVQPVLGVGDHSPEFQIAKAPPFMYVSNDSSQSFTDLTFQQFAGYAKTLVQYYDTGGFTPPGGSLLVSPGYAKNETITYWGIYNEPGINNNLQATDYVTMYNALVLAMQSADPNIKFVALELCCGNEDWATTFAQNVTPGLPVDAVATHYYSGCVRDSDETIFGTVPGFASSVQTIYANLSVNAALSNVPVWITENNVDPDFSNNGDSICYPGQPFVLDPRGSSAFFAAWRPYVFSQVGRAGAHALYHWDFAADAQYGELNASNGQTQLSYWVDYWLARMFPGGSGQELLQSTNSDTTDIEVLPVLNTDGSVVVMVSNHAVASPTDNNGAGLTADIAVDISALGTFTSASEIVLDSSTDTTNGPSPQSISPSSPLKLSMNGYSVAMIKLTP